ncbi:MAG: hypothetical protein HY438_00720 [DPANN group archaeon]|nr:hypothetical protein [DPANN group archaeon]
MLADPLKEPQAVDTKALARARQEFIDFATSPAECFDEVAPEVITAFEDCFKLPFPYDGRIRFVDRETMDSYNKASDSNNYAGRYFSSGRIWALRNCEAYDTITNIFHEIGHDVHAALSKENKDMPKILGETFAEYVQLALGAYLPFFPIFDRKFSDEIYIKAQENAQQLYQRINFADTLTGLAMCQTESDLERLLAGFNPTREEKLAHLKQVIKEKKQDLSNNNGAIYLIASAMGFAISVAPTPITAAIVAGVTGRSVQMYVRHKKLYKNHIAMARHVRDSLSHGLRGI